MNILIAEDNPVIQLLQCNFLQSKGYSYDAAFDGLEAVELAQKNSGQYDLCLMDVEMPNMNGLQATRIIRKTVDYFPILAFTANKKHQAACLSAGMDEFTIKPCPPKQLFAKIDELTTKKLLLAPNNHEILINPVTPMSVDELTELRALKKQGLTKLKLIGTGESFIVHKNTQNKISHDLIADNKELSVFIDRSAAEPGRCHLYKANLHVTKELLLTEELEAEIRREDALAVQYDKVADRSVKYQ